MNEKQLIIDCKNGDMQAFEQLIIAYQKRIYNIAYNILGNGFDAEDAAQDAFIKAYKNIDKFNEDATFYTWLYRIAHNVCLDIIRKKNKNPFKFFDNIFKNDDGAVLEVQMEDNAPSPLEIAIQNETANTVRTAISLLKENYRVVIILRDIEGLSYLDISNILEISVGTVKSRISRARDMLKILLS